MSRRILLVLAAALLAVAGLYYAWPLGTSVPAQAARSAGREARALPVLAAEVVTRPDARRDLDHRQRRADRERRRQAADRRPDRQGRCPRRPGRQSRRRAVPARQPAGAGHPRSGARDPAARPCPARQCPARARAPEAARAQGLRLQTAARRRPDHRQRRRGDGQGRPGCGRGRRGPALLHDDPGADRRPPRHHRLQARQHGPGRRFGTARDDQSAASDLRRLHGRGALSGRTAASDGGGPAAGYGHDPRQSGWRRQRGR